jgi:hypothetical protein
MQNPAFTPFESPCISLLYYPLHLREVTEIQNPYRIFIDTHGKALITFAKGYYPDQIFLLKGNFFV